MNLQHTPQIDSNSLDRLKAYDWPGNIRELQNIVERAIVLSRGGRLIFPELNAVPKVLEDQKPIQSATDVMTMDQAVTNHIRLVFEYMGDQVAGRGGAAELLQINKSSLAFRIISYKFPFAHHIRFMFEPGIFRNLPISASGKRLPQRA